MREVFLLSGEHPSLPGEEVKAVLESLEVCYRVVKKANSALILDANLDTSIKSLLRDRLAFTKQFGKLIAILDSRDPLNEKLREIDPPKIIGRFRATTIRIRGCCGWMRRADLERELGSWVLSKNPKAKVNLDSPDMEVVALLTSDLIIIFLKEYEIDRALFKIKEVAARPFVHPASMRPTLARAMVNLARTKPNDVVLDPFVGVGGIALEALSIGARVIGTDINSRMLFETKSNLIAYGFLEGFKLMLGNALDLNLEDKVDRIVTDPPYGRISKSVGFSPNELVRKFVEKSTDYLRKGGWIAISSPKGYLDASHFTSSGYEPVQSFYIREHRSLIRHLWIARLP